MAQKKATKDEQKDEKGEDQEQTEGEPQDEEQDEQGQQGGGSDGFMIEVMPDRITIEVNRDGNEADTLQRIAKLVDGL